MINPLFLRPFSKENIRKSLPKMICRDREKMGWTQEKTAETVGIPLQEYQDIEEGKVECSTEIFLRLAEAFEPISEIKGLL